MRWVFLSVIVVLAIATLIFALQNFRVVPLEFLNFSLRAPLAVLIVAFYLLGMATGGSLLAMIRWAMEGYKGPAAS